MGILHIADLELDDIAQLADSPLAEELAKSDATPVQMRFNSHQK